VRCIAYRMMFDILKAYLENCLSIFHDLNHCSIYWTNGQTKWHVRMSVPNMRFRALNECT
jgi:hypothetical protein